MFGTPLPTTVDRTQYLKEEQRAARGALVRVGTDAVPVIDRFLRENETTLSLRRQLEEISTQIQQADAEADTTG